MDHQVGGEIRLPAAVHHPDRDPLGICRQVVEPCLTPDRRERVAVDGRPSSTYW